MTETVFKNQHKVKVCVLSQPKDLVNQFIQELLQKHQEESSYRNFAALGLSISTINVQIENNRVQLILLQTSGQEFSDKLRLYYHGASGAIILFERNNQDSFEAAKRNFQFFKKVNQNSHVPVIFVDIVDKSKVIIIDDPEKLEDEPNILYYEINENNNQAFSNIIEFIISKYITTQMQPKLD